MKKISVIVPVYNVEKYLETCIDSILKQTHIHLEVILVNDGSTDESSFICEKYALLDKRIKLHHQVNRGVSSARNHALKVATGDYISFIDSDDWINPNMYKTMLYRLEAEEADMCIFTSYLRNREQAFISNIRSLSINKHEAMLEILTYNFPTSLWTSLYTKSSLENLYLNEEIHHLEDFEYQFRVLSKVSKIALCHDSFYNYRSREGSANSSGFNTKVLSCLKVLPTIENYIKDDIEIDNKYIAAAHSRLLLTIGAFLTQSPHANTKIKRELKKNARKNWVGTLQTKVPYKKKVLITLLAISYNLYAKPYKIIKG